MTDKRKNAGYPETKMQELLRSLSAIPKKPVGPHLTEDSFIGYLCGNLEAESASQTEQHLESCDECLEKMESLLELTSAWEGDAGEKRLEKLSKIIRDLILPPDTPTVWSVLLSFEWTHLPLKEAQVAFASAEQRLEDLQEIELIKGEDHGLEYTFFRLADQVKIRLTTVDAALEGKLLNIQLKEPGGGMRCEEKTKVRPVGKPWVVALGDLSSYGQASICLSIE